MTTNGSHIYQSPGSRDLQYERSCAIARCRDQIAPVPLHERNCQGARRRGLAYQWADRPCAYIGIIAGQNVCLGNGGQGQSQLQRMDSSRVSKTPVICVADGLLSFHRQSFTKARRSGLYCESRRASPENFLQRGIDSVSQEARNPVRRTIFVGMKTYSSDCFLPPLTGLGLFLHPVPRLAPWATSYRRYAAEICRCSKT
jgi:hypothetical protein